MPERKMDAHREGVDLLESYALEAQTSIAFLNELSIGDFARIISNIQDNLSRPDGTMPQWNQRLTLLRILPWTDAPAPIMDQEEYHGMSDTQTQM